MKHEQEAFAGYVLYEAIVHVVLPASSPTQEKGTVLQNFIKIPIMVLHHWSTPPAWNQLLNGTDTLNIGEMVLHPRTHERLLPERS